MPCLEVIFFLILRVGSSNGTGSSSFTLIHRYPKHDAKGNLAAQFTVISWAIFSNPAGFKCSRNSDNMRLEGMNFFLLKRQKSEPSSLKCGHRVKSLFLTMEKVSTWGEA
jgi:hypothetical protein